MDKDGVVESLKELANLLEIVGASRFQYTAFRKAASALEDWTGDLEGLVAADEVTNIPTIGKGTAAVITRLVSEGQSDDLNAVREQVPADLPKLLRYRGLGPKRVRTLWQELAIESPDDLEQAIADGRLAALKGFGPKTVDSLLSSIEYFKTDSGGAKQSGKSGSDNGAATDDSARDDASPLIPQAEASSGKIYAGTSGYSYDQWIGQFYPADAKKSRLLKHYAERLSTVEINNTFYRFPSEKVIDQWRSQSTDGFLFSLKAHRRVTHQLRLSASAKVRIVEFIDRCSVLGSSLGCILFQLPPDFERNDERLDNLLTALPQGPRYAVEFRHASWLTEDVFDKLKSMNIACVCGDSQTRKSLQIVTADFVYVRLRKTSYTTDEFEYWDQWFRQQQSARRDVFVYLKHDDSGVAPLEVKKRWCN